MKESLRKGPQIKRLFNLDNMDIEYFKKKIKPKTRLINFLLIMPLRQYLLVLIMAIIIVELSKWIGIFNRLNLRFEKLTGTIL